MAAGDVTVTIIGAGDTSAIDSWVTSARASANDHWLITSVANGLQVLIIHIEES